jgi:thiamine pyrophosphokinase
MSRFAILLGGDITATPRLRGQIAGARVIAADSGMRHAAVLGVEPELWVGDFDSSSGELIDAHHQVPKQIHPAGKDATDGELSIQAGMARGAREFMLVGGLGGQMDHVTAHLALMLRLAADASVFATSGFEEAYPLTPGQHDIDLTSGERISIVPWRDCECFSISNVEWPLTDVDLKQGSSLTLSNVALGSVRLSLKSGEGIIFAYPQ